MRQEFAVRAADLDRFPESGIPRDLTDRAGKNPRMMPQDRFFAAFFQNDGMHRVRLAKIRIGFKT